MYFVLFHDYVENLVERDPHVINGLLTEWRIREWRVVVGSAL